MSNIRANSEAVSKQWWDKIDRNFGHKKTCERQVNLTNTDWVVGLKRLELLHLAALEPKSSASTNFATAPWVASKCWLNICISVFVVGYYIENFRFGKGFFKKIAFFYWLSKIFSALIIFAKSLIRFSTRFASSLSIKGWQAWQANSDSWWFGHKKGTGCWQCEIAQPG